MNNPSPTNSPEENPPTKTSVEILKNHIDGMRKIVGELKQYLQNAEKYDQKIAEELKTGKEKKPRNYLGKISYYSHEFCKNIESSIHSRIDFIFNKKDGNLKKDLRGLEKSNECTIKIKNNFKQVVNEGEIILKRFEKLENKFLKLKMPTAYKVYYKDNIDKHHKTIKYVSLETEFYLSAGTLLGTIKEFYKRNKKTLTVLSSIITFILGAYLEDYVKIFFNAAFKFLANFF